MKRTISLLLFLAVMASLVPTAFAAGFHPHPGHIAPDAVTALSVSALTSTATPASTPKAAQEAAQALYELGLFSGIGNDTEGNPNFDLNRAPTRQEAVIMLVRLLGKVDNAENGTWNIPFTDVASWAKPYVGYAYTNGLTVGTSATTFGGGQTITATQYLTFVLRALGYEIGVDFQWDKAWEFSDKIGLTDGSYNANTSNFTRGDVAIISYKALDIRYKDGGSTLRDALPAKPVTPTANNIPEAEKSQLLDAYAEKMYYVAIGAACLQKGVAAANQHNVSDTIYWTAMTRAASQGECAALEKMKTLCGDYADTAELKKCVEEDIRLKSMGPQNITSMKDVSEYISIIGDSSYSKANRANVDAMKTQLYKLFSEKVVTDTVNQYLQQRLSK
ncbi:S-layer homology domain-containing protein [Pseudoflavonifractor sp. 524-17]|uniref:S-layer homology domain-containing protein n=1 Tax=Pseudoflavonifractor sp. 524-17 TaxID=2304577 RepID=UPI001379B8C2|nr:S-layer homology domain-containing protein [Pseudoflavonifractor sp. 524-17]